MTRRSQVVNLKGVYQKWVRLLTHIQNGTSPICRCTFEDEAGAKHAYYKLHNACVRDSWFRLVIFRRQNEVYIVKSDAIQDLIVEEL